MYFIYLEDRADKTRQVYANAYFNVCSVGQGPDNLYKYTSHVNRQPSATPWGTRMNDFLVTFLSSTFAVLAFSHEPNLGQTEQKKA